MLRTGPSSTNSGRTSGEMTITTKEQTQNRDKSNTQRQVQKSQGQGYAISAPQNGVAALIQRARVDPGSLTPTDVLQLQRTIGNQAVLGLKGFDKPKLRNMPSS